MYTSLVFARAIHTSIVLAAFLACAGSAAGQETPDPAAGQVDHSQHVMATGLFATREASGTSWQPESTPMYGIGRTAGRWKWMFHGNVFAQYLYESGERGSDQAGSINWFMAMARRSVGSGRLGIRTMLSAEAATIPGCGYPDLLATGEQCEGEGIHDRQHPHDLFMELAGEYEGPLAGPARWQVYGGVVGEPALGPVAFPHRLSAMANPLAPMSHHWLDATHITFGVVSGGVFTSRWKVEGSVFNGREPDERRTDLDLAPLDSYSGRVWFNPAPSVALQFSAGHLTDAEAGHAGEPRLSVDRITASATYHRPLGDGGIWASTAAWGRNTEADEASNAFLLETSVTVKERDIWFGRFDIAGKAAHDLDVHDSAEIFTVAKLQGGYTRYLGTWRGLRPGIGAIASASLVPSALESAYGSGVNAGFGIFVTLRPGVHRE